MGLSEVLSDTGSSCVILFGSSECGGTGKNVLKTVKTYLLSSAAEKSVFNNSVFNTGFTELSTKSSIIGNAYAAVLNEYACDGIVEGISNSSDCLFFLFKYFFAWQNVSPPKIIMPFLLQGRA